MRIIAGRLGGRTFDSPGGHRTHPMSEKARGALFNALGDIEGLTFLDAFSGSGALALEAISRGALRGIAIDNDLTAWKTIVANCEALEITERIRVHKMTIQTWAASHPRDSYDIIFADPPYDALNVTALERLVPHLTTSGILVLSWPGSQLLPVLLPLQIIANKPLGDIQLGFYRRPV